MPAAARRGASNANRIAVATPGLTRARGQPPASADQRQHDRNGERGRKHDGREHAVGIGRRPETQTLWHPFAHDRRQRGLDHGYAGSHQHGDGRELPDVAGDAAGGACDRGQEDAGQERHAGAKPCHQQRAGHGCDRKHQHRQRDQEANLRLRQL
jgi:hypothetical protein